MTVPARVLFAISGLWIFGTVGVFSQENNAAEKWVNAFTWIQTGDNLSGAEQWPLAMGSYMEAHRQLKKLAAAHPGYEPEIVAYRIERLEETMASLEEKLDADDHDLTMEWVDFIESFEKGQAERFSNDLKTAFETLEVARTLIEGIIAQNPNGFETAVQTQFEILNSSLEYLDSQLNYRRAARRTVSVDDGTDWGTTRYVKESDLPKVADGMLLDSLLFPEGVRPIPDKAAPEEAVEGEEAKVPPRRFRLNTKKETAKTE